MLKKMDIKKESMIGFGFPGFLAGQATLGEVLLLVVGMADKGAAG